MPDSYSAVYDATRRSLLNVDVGFAVMAVFRELDLGMIFQQAVRDASDEVVRVTSAYARPSAVYRPTLIKYNDTWIARYGGTGLNEGIEGCGSTPKEAMADFDRVWK